jgi:serine/threonine-protein kinase
MPGGKPRPGVVPDDSVVTRVTDLLGSPNYMAPEQLLSSRDADAQSDIWSLGVIMYRLVTGIMPFPAEDNDQLVYQVTKRPIAPLREYASTLPAGFDAVVARCMERDKSRRFATVAELARALAPYAPDNPTPSLERIALLGPEAEEGGTELMPGALRSQPSPASQHPHSRPTPISQHPHSRPTPISRNTPRSVPSPGRPDSPWSAVASQPLPQIVPAEPPREERATAYLAIAAGLVVIVGVAVAMWRIRQPSHAYTPPEALPTAASVRPPVQPSLGVPTAVPVPGTVVVVPTGTVSARPSPIVAPAGHRPKPKAGGAIPDSRE